MRKVLVIYKVDLDKKENIGVVSKMNAQIKAFEELGYEVDSIYHKSQQIFYNNNKIRFLNLSSRLGKLVFTFSFFFKTIIECVKQNDYDLIYLRYPFASGSMLKFLKTAKSQKTKILLEFPTFPYDDEFLGLSKLALLADKHYRKQLKSHVDYAVHFGLEKEIYSIPTIRTSNGIGLEMISDIPKIEELKVSDVLRIVFVGKVFHWHGVDRLINGLSPDDDFIFNMVGDGPELDNIKHLVRNRGLQDKFIFHGIKSGEELKVILAGSDLGVGTLGIHRKRLSYNSSLKHRTYAAAGLPFVYSGSDVDFDGVDFVYQFSDDETYIHFSDIRQFLINPTFLAKKILLYASNQLLWTIKIKTVLKKVFE